MGTTDLRALVDDLLRLVREGSGDRARDEAALARLLDALALASHDVPEREADADAPEPPEWPYPERRALVVERFPELGLYDVVLPCSDALGAAEVLVGDAIDDVADIAGDLHDVAWAFRRGDEADALWRFRFTFDGHWGEHLRDLQRYLHARRAER